MADLVGLVDMVGVVGLDKPLTPNSSPAERARGEKQDVLAVADLGAGIAIVIMATLMPQIE